MKDVCKIVKKYPQILYISEIDDSTPLQHNIQFKRKLNSISSNIILRFINYNNHEVVGSSTHATPTLWIHYVLYTQHSTHLDVVEPVSGLKVGEPSLVVDVRVADILKPPQTVEVRAVHEDDIMWCR